MTTMEAIEARHAVRKYRDKPIEPEKIEAIRAEIEACNEEGQLNIQLVIGDTYGFDSPMGRVGKFSGVQNYIALVGMNEPTLEERCGYYGEKIVIRAQMLGLNTCWAAMSYSKQNVKRKIKMKTGERLVAAIALGYGETQGVPHKSKAAKMVALDGGQPAEWFTNGVKAALLAPTAMNQQKFLLRKSGERVSIMPGTGPCTRIDMGIVEYNFEQGAGRSDVWMG